MVELKDVDNSNDQYPGLLFKDELVYNVKYAASKNAVLLWQYAKSNSGPSHCVMSRASFSI